MQDSHGILAVSLHAIVQVALGDLLAKEIIEGFGGTITARKKPQGSIFSINFPQYVSNERQQLLNLMDIHNSSD